MIDLEKRLSRHLGPVRAPEGLWDRLQERPHQPIRWVIWPAVAAVALLLWQVRAAPEKTPALRASGGCVACHVRGL